MTSPKMDIRMADPTFSKLAKDYITSETLKILDSALSMGENVAQFERQMAEMVGVKHAIAFNSCTSALEAALIALKTEGREVIVPVQTFIATGMSVYNVGGIPIFTEISEKTLCLDIEDVKAKITNNTAGIILVHFAGLISDDVLELRLLCKKKGIFLLEDAAHSPGAEFNGIKAGALGDAGCFSFYPTKVITAAEGGMLTTNSDDIARFARSYQHRGRDMSSSSEEYIVPGRNVRLTEFSGLLGRVQLDCLNDYLARRREIASIYKKLLKDCEYLNLVLPNAMTASAFWKLPILMHETVDRDLVIKHLRSKGIAADTAYTPALHLQPVFKKLYDTEQLQLSKSVSIMARQLNLPCHPGLTDSEIEYVAHHLLREISSQLNGGG